MRNFALILLLVAVISLAGCAGRERLDLDAEKVKVQIALDKYLKAVSEADIAVIETLVDTGSDTVAIGIGPSEFFTGWNSIKESLARSLNLLSASEASVADQVIKVYPDGRIAWFSETLSLNFMAGGKPVTLEGVRFSGVLVKKNDGRWVIANSHISISVIKNKVIEEKIKEEKGKEEKRGEEEASQEKDKENKIPQQKSPEKKAEEKKNAEPKPAETKKPEVKSVEEENTKQEQQPSTEETVEIDEESY